MTYSFGYGISGGQQVGTGWGSASGNFHAFLWSGTAASAVDLNPSGFTYSYAYGISGGQQVGYGSPHSVTGEYDHALLWSGTADSVVDLHPSGFTHSYAYGTSGSQQVGNGWNGTVNHALLWSGTAGSVVDLGSLLSSDYTSSYATGIDANGNVIGYAHHIPSNQDHAIVWAVPEPDAVVLLLFGGVSLLMRKRL
jgi:hypothetical protein